MSQQRRIILPASRLPTDGGTIALDAEEQRYLRKVLRLQVGAKLQIRDGQGGEWLAAISKRDELTLEPRTELQWPNLPRTTLNFCPPKGRRLDLLLEKATELGAFSLAPIRVERSVRIIDETPERWSAIIRSAGAQCGAAWLPEVNDSAPLLDALDRSSGLVLMAHPGGQPLLEVLQSEDPPKHIHFITGPEGGFTEAEVTQARRAGAKIVSLGPTIVRSETAPIIGLAVIGAAFWRG